MYKHVKVYLNACTFSWRMHTCAAISDLGVSFTDGMTGATTKFEVRQLREKLRLLVVYGNKETLRETIEEAGVSPTHTHTHTHTQ